MLVQKAERVNYELYTSYKLGYRVRRCSGVHPGCCGNYVPDSLVCDASKSLLKSTIGCAPASDPIRARTRSRKRADDRCKVGRSLTKLVPTRGKSSRGQTLASVGSAALDDGCRSDRSERDLSDPEIGGSVRPCRAATAGERPQWPPRLLAGDRGSNGIDARPQRGLVHGAIWRTAVAQSPSAQIRSTSSPRRCPIAGSLRSRPCGSTSLLPGSAASRRAAEAQQRAGTPPEEEVVPGEDSKENYRHLICLAFLVSVFRKAPKRAPKLLSCGSRPVDCARERRSRYIAQRVIKSLRLADTLNPSPPEAKKPSARKMRGERVPLPNRPASPKAHARQGLGRGKG